MLHKSILRFVRPRGGFQSRWPPEETISARDVYVGRVNRQLEERDVKRLGPYVQDSEYT